MNTKLARDIIVGLLAGYVPINAMGSKMGDKCVKNGYSLISVIRYAPLFFAVLFPAIMAAVRYLIPRYANNYWALGLIFGLIVSSIGRFGMDSPTKLFEMPNPNMFHIYAIVAWEFFFHIIARLVYSL